MRMSEIVCTVPLTDIGAEAWWAPDRHHSLERPGSRSREHLTFCLGRPQPQSQCHRLRGVCGRAPIFTSLRIRTVNPWGRAVGVAHGLDQRACERHRCRVRIVSVGLALSADELAYAGRNDQRVNTWVQQPPVSSMG